MSKSNIGKTLFRATANESAVQFVVEGGNRAGQDKAAHDFVAKKFADVDPALVRVESYPNRPLPQDLGEEVETVTAETIESEKPQRSPTAMSLDQLRQAPTAEESVASPDTAGGSGVGNGPTTSDTGPATQNVNNASTRSTSGRSSR